MTTCVFCEIAEHRSPARVVFEDSSTIAFLPLSPAAEGHTLVVPKRHAHDIWAMGEADAQRLLAVAVSVGEAVRSAMHPEGMNLITSAGEAASQTVPHAHVHLVPRWPGDRMGPIWPHRAEEDLLDTTYQDRIAHRIAAATGFSSC